jgi:hypothetical protein
MKREVVAYAGKSSTGLLRGRSGPSNQHGDTGGASRFYKQFKNETEFLNYLVALILPEGGKLLEGFPA